MILLKQQHYAQVLCSFTVVQQFAIMLMGEHE